MKKLFSLFFILLAAVTAAARDTYNFNSGWTVSFERSSKGAVRSLPYAWNEYDAFAVDCNNMPDSVVWYSKRFRLPKMNAGDRVIIEFEGAKQGAELWLNKHKVGLHEDGVMAFGYDITPFVRKGENLIEVKTDNDRRYEERSTGKTYQWNYSNFNCNYGGVTKNVKLHIVPKVYQTFNLWNALGTTGQYIYGSDYDIAGRSAVVNVESEVRNTSSEPAVVTLTVSVEEMDGKAVTSFKGAETTVGAGETAVLKACGRAYGLHFWSWGCGYLYNVRTSIGVDEVTTTTGFRKAEFKNGMIYLNDRVLMVHGYAQRSTNEWPCVGNGEPPWLSDFSNNLQVESGGNLVRWMHITPSRQDIESCDRVGLIEAMPAGDSEKDASGRQWEQRTEVMRDAIIYNRNQPSILFYECGNNNISEEHMAQMKALKEKYDPKGMRAIGSRNMLSTKTAEYGGEMLYINKSDNIPMWQMEYCRDEGLRKYWNSWSYPYHEEGSGPLYREAPAPSYNHNSDLLAVEHVRRWYDYWHERPGQGTRVNSGGTKIIFSDSQSHARGETNFRTSGNVDPMRIPKDAFFAHQVMWTGWVEDEEPKIYIIGHWQAPGATSVVPHVYVVSNCDSVRLYVNGKETPSKAKHAYRYLWTYDDVPYEAGEIKAVGYGFLGSSKSAPAAVYTIETAGAPDHIRLTAIENPSGWKADGSDVALVQAEVVDKEGRRCPLADDTITYTVKGPAEYLGGEAHEGTAFEFTSDYAGALKKSVAEEDMGKGKPLDGNFAVVPSRELRNWTRQTTFPVDAGVARLMLRSGVKSGVVTLTASAKHLTGASVRLSTTAVSVKDGLSTYFPSDGLYRNIRSGNPSTTRESAFAAVESTRGETPLSPSFVQSKRDIKIIGAVAAVGGDMTARAYDGDESTSWQSDSNIDNSWIRFTLAEDTPVSEVCIKPVSFRSKSYPIEIYAGDTLVWKGWTPKSLTYERLPLQKRGIRSREYTVRMSGQTREGDAFGQVKEMEKENNEKKVSGRNALRILEIEFITDL